MSDVEDFDADENFGIDDDCCIECLDTFRYDDCGGYNPPCSCGMHCRSCHEAVEGERDDDLDPDERDADEQADSETEHFWDRRVGRSADAADNEELPF